MQRALMTARAVLQELQGRRRRQLQKGLLLPRLLGLHPHRAGPCPHSLLGPSASAALRVLRRVALPRLPSQQRRAQEQPPPQAPGQRQRLLLLLAPRQSTARASSAAWARAHLSRVQCLPALHRQHQLQVPLLQLGGAAGLLVLAA